MSITSVAHLNFRGQAKEALGFYHSVFGGHLAAVTYADAHNVQDPAEAEQIMWGQVLAPNGFHVMAYDVPGSQTYDPGDRAFFLSLRGDTAEEITALWEGLRDGATIVQPLRPAQWSPLYGMLTDRYGITWVADVAVPYTG